MRGIKSSSEEFPESPNTIHCRRKLSIFSLTAFHFKLRKKEIQNFRADVIHLTAFMPFTYNNFIHYSVLIVLRDIKWIHWFLGLGFISPWWMASQSEIIARLTSTKDLKGYHCRRESCITLSFYTFEEISNEYTLVQKI